MKKLLAIFVLILTVTLCSCYSQQTYITQDCIKQNYNNISAGSFDYYINNKFVCYTQHNLTFDLFRIDAKGKQLIDVLDYSNDYHIYKNKLYYFNNTLSGYNFIEYDFATKKSTTIATVYVERIYNFFIVDKYLYIETGDNDSLTKNIIVFSLNENNQRLIAENIFSSGIINSNLYYLTAENNTFTVYEYSYEYGTKKINEFRTDVNDFKEIENRVNFTTDSILLFGTNRTTNESIIYIYDYKNNSLKHFVFKGLINELISYDKYAFLSTYDINEPFSFSVYRFNIAEQNTEKIADFNDTIYLFVGSDKDVYISSVRNFEGIRHYSIDGKYENIIVD